MSSVKDTILAMLTVDLGEVELISFDMVKCAMICVDVACVRKRHVVARMQARSLYERGNASGQHLGRFRRQNLIGPQSGPHSEPYTAIIDERLTSFDNDQLDLQNLSSHNAAGKSVVPPEREEASG